MQHLTPYFTPAPSGGPTPTLDEWLAYTGCDPLDPDAFPIDPGHALAELRARADAQSILDLQ